MPRELSFPDLWRTTGRCWYLDQLRYAAPVHCFASSADNNHSRQFLQNETSAELDYLWIYIILLNENNSKFSKNHQEWCYAEVSEWCLSVLTILWLFNCRITAAVEGHNPPWLPGRREIDNLASGIRLLVFQKGGPAKDTFISRLVCHARPTCRKYSEAIKWPNGNTKNSTAVDS